MRLSVVVPCHDVARFLPVTLAAVDANAADDVEWLFVDDGSRDATGAILEAFSPVAGTARVLRNETALGLAEARDTGVRAASGRYLTFLDADDWLAPGYLPVLADAIEELGVDFVRVDHVQTKGLTRATHRAPEAHRNRALPPASGIGLDPRRLTMVDYPYAWAGVYDMRLRDRGLLTLDRPLHTAEDRLWSWRLHLHAETYAVRGLLGYFYRREVPGSLTSIGTDEQLHFFDAFDAIGAELDASPAFAAFQPKFVRTYLGLLVHHEEQRARLQPGVHRMFLARAATTIAGLDPDLVAATLTTMEPARVRVVERLR